MTYPYPTPADVDLKLDQILAPEDEVLQATRQFCHDAGLPAIEVSAQQGKMLELLARTARASNILEIGTLGGYSTICLARAAQCRAAGRVTTLEFEPKHSQVALSNISFAGLSDIVEVITGDAHDTLLFLKTEIDALARGRFDFVFIDADKESNLRYTDMATLIGTEDVTIVVDNVIRDGRVLAADRPEKLEFIQWLGESDLDVSVVQTVGAKGWDGFVLAKRKAL